MSEFKLRCPVCSRTRLFIMRRHKKAKMYECISCHARFNVEIRVWKITNPRLNKLVEVDSEKVGV